MTHRISFVSIEIHVIQAKQQKEREIVHGA